MSLKYFARYRFNNASDVAEEDYGIRDLAVESGDLASYEDPVHGWCLSLDGATSLLSTGSFSNVADDVDRGFSFWIRLPNDSVVSPVFSYGQLSGPNAFVLYARNALGSPEFYDYTRRKSPTDVVVPTDRWSFLAFSCRAGVLSIFIDGVLGYSESVALTTGTSDPFRIGTDGEGEYLEGFLLDLRMWESSLDAQVVEYMFSVGPNYQEDLATHYAEDADRSGIVTGNILCRTSYGIRSNGETLTESYFCYDGSAQVQEAARIEHSQDSDTGVASNVIRIRQRDSLMQETVRMTPESTTFTSADEAGTESSVVFSSAGVSLAYGKGCVYFGAGKQFRIRVGDGSFLVEALSSETGEYVKKMQVLP